MIHRLVKKVKNKVREELGKGDKHCEENDTDPNIQSGDISKLSPGKLTTKTVKFNNTIEIWGKSEVYEANNKSKGESSPKL